MTTTLVNRMLRKNREVAGSRVLFPIAMVLVVVSSGADADWAVEPFVSSSLAFDDNIQFSASDEISSTGLSANAGVVISNETEAVKTRIEPRLSFRSYSEDSDLNSLDQFLTLSTLSLGERSDLGLALSFANDSTRTSELEDSGITFLNKRRTFFSMTPSWRYLLTPLTSVKVTYRFDGSQYEDSGQNGLNDFENQTATVDLARRLSEDSDFIVRGYYQRYKVLELTNKANTLGIELGYKRKFSPRLEGSVFAGGVNTDSTTEGRDDTSSGGSGSAQLAFKGEKARYVGKYRLSVEPSSTGEAYLRNRVTAGIDARLTEKLSWKLDFLAQNQKPVSDISTQTDRKYYSISPSLSWRLKKDWRLQARYTFLAEDRSGATDAKRNQAYVGVEYRKARLTVY